jgi:hypothetical protein
MRSRFSRCTLAMLALAAVFSFPALACSFLQPALPKLDSNSNETDMAAAVNASLTANAETAAVNASLTANAETKLALATPTPPPSPTLPPPPTSADTAVPVVPPTQTPSPTPTGVWIGAITFASELDSNNEPVDPGTVFKKGITHLYGVFPYSGMEKGMQITYYWTLNEKEFVSFIRNWEEDSSGTYASYTYYTNGRQLDAGNWMLKIFVENKLMQTGTCKIIP